MQIFPINQRKIDIFLLNSQVEIHAANLMKCILTLNNLKHTKYFNMLQS